MSDTVSDTAAARVQRNLLRLGAGLFLLGLLSGLVTQAMANPRMGLSAHMQGITNGVFLIALGAAWRHVRLGRRLQWAAFWLLAYGTVMNWLATSLAALWGTGQMTPIVSPEPSAPPWQEAIVSAGLLTLTLAMLAGIVLVLIGLFRRPNAGLTLGDSERR